jgi:hypothetical protein
MPNQPRIQASEGFVTTTAALIATGGNDQVAGREPHPLKIQAFYGARCPLFFTQYRTVNGYPIFE